MFKESRRRRSLGSQCRRFDSGDILIAGREVVLPPGESLAEDSVRGDFQFRLANLLLMDDDGDAP